MVDGKGKTESKGPAQVELGEIICVPDSASMQATLTVRYTVTLVKTPGFEENIFSTHVYINDVDVGGGTSESTDATRADQVVVTYVWTGSVACGATYKIKAKALVTGPFYSDEVDKECGAC
ncbi:MAG: hypothetical protein KDA62_04910 [Planctomycetales bacterium]|nr:hypothetical protein [Planctomycetales bacterium]